MSSLFFFQNSFRITPPKFALQGKNQRFLIFVVKEKNRELLVWCFKSDGLNKVNHLEVVIMLEIKRKEDVFPEEVLRVYKGILFLATKYGR